jgi:hypothetical protein
MDKVSAAQAVAFVSNGRSQFLLGQAELDFCCLTELVELIKYRFVEKQKELLQAFTENSSTSGCAEAVMLEMFYGKLANYARFIQPPWRELVNQLLDLEFAECFQDSEKACEFTAVRHEDPSEPTSNKSTYILTHIPSINSLGLRVSLRERESGCGCAHEASAHVCVSMPSLNQQRRRHIASLANGTYMSELSHCLLAFPHDLVRLIQNYHCPALTRADGRAVVLCATNM